MSEKKKRKPKEIHVDKLIIKADQVILHDEDEKNPRPRPRDPWGFFFPRFDNEFNEAGASIERDDDREEEKKDHKDEKQRQEEERPRGWSWI